jgi:hypothetical protein
MTNLRVPKDQPCPESTAGETLHEARTRRLAEFLRVQDEPVRQPQPELYAHPAVVKIIDQQAADLSRQSGFSRSEEDDIRQGMTIYIWEKSHLFNPSRGSVEAFAITALKSWIGMERRRRRRDKRCIDFRAVSLDSTMIECDGESNPLSSVIGEQDGERRRGGEVPDIADRVALLELFHKVQAALTSAERTLLRDVIEHGVAGAARIRKVSRRQINRRLAAIRAKFSGWAEGERGA